MKPFSHHQGIAVVLDRTNVDTDSIIPKQYLKSVARTGFGANLFDDWRYLSSGGPDSDHAKRPRNPDFVLNQPRYQKATILVTGANFGCGSSREHAVWAFLDAGFRAILAPNFADIFDINAAKCGLLTITLPEAIIYTLMRDIEATEGAQLTIDLHEQTVRTDSQETHHFSIDPQRRHCLLQGLDDIALSLQHTDSIRQFEVQRRARAPWLFDRFGERT